VRTVLLSLTILFLFGCTLYESDGRKAIAKNENGLLTSGLDTRYHFYYECQKETTLPAFLKEPLEVIETSLERQNISVLTNTSSSPAWLVLYHHLRDQDAHTYCLISPTYNLDQKQLRAVITAGYEILKPHIP
jgi:hypothetical protein